MVDDQDSAEHHRASEPTELLRGVEPIESIEDLAIPGLTEDEVVSFLRAIRE